MYSTESGFHIDLEMKTILTGTIDYGLCFSIVANTLAALYLEISALKYSTECRNGTYFKRVLNR